MKKKNKVVYALLSTLAVVALLGACTGSAGGGKNGAQATDNGDLSVEKVSDVGDTGGESVNDRGAKSSGLETHSARPPQVKVRGQVYQDTGYVNSAVTCGTTSGKIVSSVDSWKTPEKDDESNFGVGFGYQRWDPGYLNVRKGDKWLMFQDIAMNSSTIPQGVANFSAKVVETDEDRLLVRVSEIPEEYKWVFAQKSQTTPPDKNLIKPIALPIDNLDYSKDGKTVTAEGLKGKTVKVWFDGTVTKTEPEMSYPAQLGKVYKIVVQ